MEIEINSKNWWILTPFILLIVGILLYRSYDRRAEVNRIQPFVKNLDKQDAFLVSEALLEIRKSELYAEHHIDRIISLLGDNRHVPEEIRKRPDFSGAFPLPPGFESFSQEIHIGDLAAAALVSIGAASSGGLLYSESDLQSKIQRRISTALQPIFSRGTSEQKKDAMRVINITRVRANLPVIAELLNDEDSDVRGLALGLYISYAPLFDLSPYLPGIKRLTQDEDEAVRMMAERVLVIIRKRE